MAEYDISPALTPEYTIFLSHSGEEKAFVEQLCEDFKRVNYSPFFDQDSDSLPRGKRFASLIFQAAEQCLLAVVVLSRGYSTSKWPILELSAFVKSRTANNSNLKVFPIFYKLSLDDLGAAKVETEWTKEWEKLVVGGKLHSAELSLGNGGTGIGAKTTSERLFTSMPRCG